MKDTFRLVFPRLLEWNWSTVLSCLYMFTCSITHSIDDVSRSLLDICQNTNFTTLSRQTTVCNSILTRYRDRLVLITRKARMDQMFVFMGVAGDTRSKAITKRLFSSQILDAEEEKEVERIHLVIIIAVCCPCPPRWHQPSLLFPFFLSTFLFPFV